MKIGFTGTREGMTDQQKQAFRGLLLDSATNPELTHFHHGACIGADEDAAVIAAEYRDAVHSIAHPGKSVNGMPNECLSGKACELADEVRPTLTHFERNRNIVNFADVLIACPNHSQPIDRRTRGGTAYTINFARKQGKPVWIIRPDGTIEE